MIPAFMVLIIAVISSISAPPAQWNQQQTPADYVEDTSQQSPSKTTITVIDNQNASDDEEDRAKDEPFQRPEKPPWWDVTWATWVLVMVGFCGTLFALWSLFTLREQTSEIRKGSDIAKASSDALVNSERAWIDGMFVLNTTLVTRIALNITNHGKTPAHLHGYEVGIGWFAKTGEQRGPHDLHLHTFVVENIDILLGKGEKKEGIHLLDPIRDFADEALSGKETVLIYGKVKYWDTVTVGDKSRAPRETSFVYTYHLITGAMMREAKYTVYG
jgi:hypothetical protein